MAKQPSLEALGKEYDEHAAAVADFRNRIAAYQSSIWSAEQAVKTHEGKMAVLRRLIAEGAGLIQTPNRTSHQTKVEPLTQSEVAAIDAQMNDAVDEINHSGRE